MALYPRQNSTLGFDIQVSNSTFKFWIRHSSFEFDIQVLNSTFKFWIQHSSFEFDIQVLNSTFDIQVLISTCMHSTFKFQVWHSSFKFDIQVLILHWTSRMNDLTLSKKICCTNTMQAHESIHVHLDIKMANCPFQEAYIQQFQKMLKTEYCLNSAFLVRASLFWNKK